MEKLQIIGYQASDYKLARKRYGVSLSHFKKTSVCKKRQLRRILFLQVGSERTVVLNFPYFYFNLKLMDLV